MVAPCSCCRLRLPSCWPPFCFETHCKMQARRSPSSCKRNLWVSKNLCVERTSSLSSQRSKRHNLNQETHRSWQQTGWVTRSSASASPLLDEQLVEVITKNYLKRVGPKALKKKIRISHRKRPIQCDHFQWATIGNSSTTHFTAMFKMETSRCSYPYKPLTWLKRISMVLVWRFL